MKFSVKIAPGYHGPRCGKHWVDFFSKASLPHDKRHFQTLPAVTMGFAWARAASPWLITRAAGPLQAYLGFFSPRSWVNVVHCFIPHSVLPFCFIMLFSFPVTSSLISRSLSSVLALEYSISFLILSQSDLSYFFCHLTQKSLEIFTAPPFVCRPLTSVLYRCDCRCLSGTPQNS